MKKFLFLGTKVAAYHGSAGIDEQVSRLLKDEWEMTYAEDLALFTPEGLAQFDMVVSYLEFNKQRVITDEQADALVSFVENGGTLMGFHNGIALQTHPRLHQLFGARFCGHPYYEAMPILPYRVVKQHPITEGVNTLPWVSPDEPYRFEMLEDDKEIFLVYDYEGKEWPAAWYRHVGKGKVIYFANGHCRCAFYTEFSKLIVGAARWALNG
ncbi:MAG: ThuA domain-containing protein [Clostridia bacterium]|nr:ThuA domain-containing protein [Clostridia bacterium]